MTRTDTIAAMLIESVADLAEIGQHVTLLDAGSERDLRLVAETVADVATRLRIQHQARTAGLFGETT